MGTLRVLGHAGLGAVLLTWTIACGPEGGTGSSPLCVTPGESGACTCAGGTQATRICGDDKKWGACACPDVTNSTDATDVTDASDATDATDATDNTGTTDVTDSTESTDSTDVTDSTDSTDSTDATDNPPPLAGPVDPDCVDGQYEETLPPGISVSIASDISSYTPSGYIDFLEAILTKRYPIGWYLMETALPYEVQTNMGVGNCVDGFMFPGDQNSAGKMLSSLGTFVHECGHVADIHTGGGFGDATYLINETLTFTCKDGGPFQFGGKTFARSRIKDDKFSKSLVPCASFGGGGNDCDSYAFIYLDGNPDDGTFQGGDQGFDSLLEETTQYVNSLATGYAFSDQQSFSSSDRDGILTFLWYVMRYLNMARLEYPDTYKLLRDNSCWRNVILTVWGRAWLYLEATEDVQGLGISDDDLIELVRDPDLLNEIELLRDAEGC